MIPGIHSFFRFAREREAIRLKQAAGEPRHWTKDPILRKYRFCNIFREDDRTTAWFREHIRGPMSEREDVLLATVAFRWFNRIETGEAIKDILLECGYDRARVEARLRPLQKEGPLFTGAYIIKSPDGMDKLTGILNCIDKVKAGLDGLHFVGGTDTLEAAHAELMRFPFMGSFIAYEAVTDLRHTYLLRDASDIMSWASAGPGCARGLGWVMYDNQETFNYGSRKGQLAMLSPMRTLLRESADPVNWPSDWPSWEMREVEHTLCEYDKWKRGLRGENLKRIYVPQ